MTTDRLELRRSVAGLATTLVLLALAMVPAVWGVWHARGPLWGRVSFVALLAASFLALVVIGVRGYRSFISNDGVHQPALLGGRETFIAWADVERVESFRGLSLHVRAGQRRVVLPLYTFADPAHVIALVRDRTNRG
jgi:hypothetical protein